LVKNEKPAQAGFAIWLPEHPPEFMLRQATISSDQIDAASIAKKTLDT